MGRLTGRYYDVTNDIWHWSIKSNSTNDGLVATPQDILDKLAYYEDMEEQGLLIKLDLNQYKRDDLDRCTHRHCNNCDKYRRELQKYKDLEELGRLIEVVRCKDCYHRIERCGMGSHKWCEIWEGTTGENDFCSYGVARTEIKEAEAKLNELEGDKDGR